MLVLPGIVGSTSVTFYSYVLHENRQDINSDRVVSFQKIAAILK
ncbi:hypothetical protein KsCSTR_46870 [Candidatus Kuenenia stuttgartiensis]|uniref:Uncharacterized protein n=1 Tax=Kuenenia stuttgartiensis TaxID=174633 RepID=A0A6G7GX19_KUEST|nr:hypothetical protein KsCSTR_46870 [Candidatus Kuenenia stuttgartiensis]